MGLNLLKLLKELGMYPDHWYSPEEPLFYHPVIEKESRLVERDEFHELPLDLGIWKGWLSKEKAFTGGPSKVFIIDGVRKVHKRLCGWDEPTEGCIGEVIVGHILWDREKGVRPCSKPSIRRVIILPEHKTWNLKEEKVFIPLMSNFDFELEKLSPEGEDKISKSINNVLLSEERSYVKRLLEDKEGFILKDGTMHPEIPTFEGHLYGPVGLVKKVLREHLPQEFLYLLRELKKGQRTPFYAVYVREREDLIRVMCYLRVAEGAPHDSPRRGIVRLEALVGRKEFEVEEYRERLKKELSFAFDFLSGFLSSMVVKGYDLPRSPENLPIVFSLESWLSCFFLPSEYISAILEGGV